MSTHINMRNQVLENVQRRRPKKPFPWIAVIMLLAFVGLGIIMVPLIVNWTGDKPVQDTAPASELVEQPLIQAAKEKFGVTDQDVAIYHMEGDTFRVTVKKDGIEYTIAVGVMVNHKQITGGGK